MGLSGSLLGTKKVEDIPESEEALVGDTKNQDQVAEELIPEHKNHNW